MKGNMHVTCIHRIQQNSAIWPLFLLYCVCHQAFKIELLWEPCCRKMCLCTLMHPWHAYTQKYKCQGSVAEPEFGFRWLWSDTSRCLCHCQPWEKLQLWARGWCCWSRMCFQWWGLAMHVDMLRQIPSTFLPSSSHGCQKYWVPVATHTYS